MPGRPPTLGHNLVTGRNSALLRFRSSVLPAIAWCLASLRVLSCTSPIPELVFRAHLRFRSIKDLQMGSLWAGSGGDQNRSSGHLPAQGAGKPDCRNVDPARPVPRVRMRVARPDAAPGTRRGPACSATPSGLQWALRRRKHWRPGDWRPSDIRAFLAGRRLFSASLVAPLARQVGVTLALRVPSTLHLDGSDERVDQSRHPSGRVAGPLICLGRRVSCRRPDRRRQRLPPGERC